MMWATTKVHPSVPVRAKVKLTVAGATGDAVHDGLFACRSGERAAVGGLVGACGVDRMECRGVEETADRPSESGSTWRTVPVEVVAPSGYVTVVSVVGRGMG